MSIHRFGGMAATGVVALLLAAAGARAAEKIQFNRDVRPILADNCFACHGPDSNHRKAGLRFDTKEGFFEKTTKHEPTVVPGHLLQSELWLRITTTNLDDRMPPEDSHKTLKPEQIETLRKWILAGAPWEGHWAFLKPERPIVPKIRNQKSEIRLMRSYFPSSRRKG